MKLIELTKGKSVMVDDADFEWLNGFSWHASKGRKTWYAAGKTPLADGEHHFLSMHRMIMGAKPGDIVDHEDGNGLNDQRYNLRLATHGTNLANQPLQARSKSGLKGVIWSREKSKWRAQITAHSKNFHLGYFKDAIAAAMAYDKAAVDNFGEFAATNESLGLLGNAKLSP